MPPTSVPRTLWRNISPSMDKLPDLYRVFRQDSTKENFHIVTLRMSATRSHSLESILEKM
jgi:hypothetical protein